MIIRRWVHVRRDRIPENDARVMNMIIDSLLKSKHFGYTILSARYYLYIGIMVDIEIPTCPLDKVWYLDATGVQGDWYGNTLLTETCFDRPGYHLDRVFATLMHQDDPVTIRGYTIKDVSPFRTGVLQFISGDDAFMFELQQILYYQDVTYVPGKEETRYTFKQADVENLTQCKGWETNAAQMVWAL